ncbi:MAG: hypothetical protein Q9209_003201 [Squamulea sp. 1 TL-2023]
MPRGAEYSDGHPASDNAIEAGENKVAGAPKEENDTVSDSVDRSGKAAPLPEGLDEMKHSSKSGAGSQNLPGGGKNVDGKGDIEPTI